MTPPVGERRAIEDLPVWTDGEDPSFGVNFDSYAADLFARPYQGLLRTPPAEGEGFGTAGGLVAYRNADLRALMAHPALTNTPADVLSRPFAEELADGREHGFLTTFRHSVFTQRPPAHGPSKKLFAKQLTSGSVRRYRDDATAIVRARAAAVSGREELDLRADFAEPVVAEFWSRVLGLTYAEVCEISEFAVRFQRGNHFDVTSEDRADINLAGEQLVAALEDVLRREVDGGRVELLRDLVADFEAMEETGRPDSLEAHFGVSLIDGFHTLPAEIVSVLYALTTSPESLAAVRADPSLVPDAYQEAIRLHAGVTITQRYVEAEMEYEGLAIPAGTLIQMLWLLGNRDPAVHEAPNEFRLGRGHRPDTTFGGGSYVCPGRNVVKMLCEVALAELTRPGVDLVPTGPPEWEPASAIHEPLRAPFRLLAAAS